MNLAHALHETRSQFDLIDPTSFPASRYEVTEAWLRDTLSRHQRFQSDPIEAVRLSNLGDGIGQLSALTLAEIDCRSGRRMPLVVKLQASVPEMHQMARQYDHYGSEVNFYRELAADIPMQTPAVYVSAMDSERDRVLIIMEAFTDWHSPDQVAGATAEQVAIAAGRLAGLASAYWNDQPQARLPWLRSADSQAFATLPEDHAACLSLLSLTAIPLIGGANMDIGNGRPAALFAAMGGRLVTAIQDWDAVDLLDRL